MSLTRRAFMKQSVAAVASVAVAPATTLIDHGSITPVIEKVRSLITSGVQDRFASYEYRGIWQIIDWECGRERELECLDSADAAYSEARELAEAHGLDFEVIEKELRDAFYDDLQAAHEAQKVKKLNSAEETETTDKSKLNEGKSTDENSTKVHTCCNHIKPLIMP